MVDIRQNEVTRANNNPSILSTLSGGSPNTTMTTPPEMGQATNIAQDLSSKLYGSGFSSGGSTQAEGTLQELFNYDKSLEAGNSPFPTTPGYVDNPADLYSAGAGYAGQAGRNYATSIGAVSTAEKSYQDAITGVLSKFTDFLTLQEQRKAREEDRAFEREKFQYQKEKDALDRAGGSGGTATERLRNQYEVRLINDAQAGVPIEDLIVRYGGALDYADIRALYDQYSSYGPAKRAESEYRSIFDQLGVVDKNPLATEQQENEVSQTVNLIDEIYGRDLAPATGTLRIRGGIPGTDAYTTKIKLDQLVDKLALAARGQLKGQGQISDKETQMLKDAVAALNLKQSESNIRAELQKIRGILTGNAGGIRLVDPTSGAIYQYDGENDPDYINDLQSGFRRQ